MQCPKLKKIHKIFIHMQYIPPNNKQKAPKSSAYPELLSIQKKTIQRTFSGALQVIFKENSAI